MSQYFRNYKKKFPGDFYYYGVASHAFYDVLMWLQKTNPKVNPNIVLPVFIPAKLYRVVLAAGYKPKFYDPTINCSVNINEVESLIDDETQAIFCVHYFGIPAPVIDLKRVTERNKIILIEDCAHTLMADFRGMELGTIGDAILFSTRKMLQLPAGGFLILNCEQTGFKPSYKKRVKSLYTACKGGKTRIKQLYNKITKGADPLALAWIPRTSQIDVNEKHYFTIKKISWLNKAYLKTINLEKVIRKRRENYNYVLNGIKELDYLNIISGPVQYNLIKEAGSHYYLREGITPYSLPVILPEELRDYVRYRLCEIGIGCGAGWPEAPFGYTEFTNTRYFSECLLELPIHQGMNYHQLKNMVEFLKGLSNKVENNLDKNIESKRLVGVN